MSDYPSTPRRKDKHTKHPDPVNTSTPSKSKFDIVQNALMSPFGGKNNDTPHRKSKSTNILEDLAPAIMTPKMMAHASTVNARGGGGNRQRLLPAGSSHSLDFATLGRAPMRLSLGTRRISSRDLEIVEATDELLEQEIPEADTSVSLLRGFSATIPSSEANKSRRRQLRHVDLPRLGGSKGRGLLTGPGDDLADEAESVVSEDDVVIIDPSSKRKGKGKLVPKRKRESLSAAKFLGTDELKRQSHEIMKDKENLHVRRRLINHEIAEITHKIESLDAILQDLEHDLIRIQEEELELDDEYAGVQERLEFERHGSDRGRDQSVPSRTSKRRRGPAFLPSEHDQLPPGVAFMTLESHIAPIVSLDFSEPYGTLVSTSTSQDPQPRVWDLMSASEIGRLRGHQGAVRCVQVEDQLCLTGGEDGDVRLWDLRKVDDDDEGELVELSEIIEEDEEGHAAPTNGVHSPTRESPSKDVCTRVLQGHTKRITSLYFDDECLVTGASDKTLRQWDLSTGQCVMTMDILWAMNHSSLPAPAFGGNADEDFVGGLQFWGYGLVSGSADGAVRMWDMRTGQNHRTLVGHTAPISCLQFDELHIVTGSRDKTIRIWDLRTGGTLQTLKYDFPVNDLQFDSRKVIAATEGDSGVKIFNRTSGQQSTITMNGHSEPVQRLRFMDRYLVTGGREGTVKVWSL
ncbi:WD40-repeat-containing domain protein [Flagelloscypha sp. PMI_526]|nr:WD40-repeat-containing domain protein [Flagelloscypha sp. PMI_526]